MKAGTERIMDKPFRALLLFCFILSNRAVAESIFADLTVEEVSQVVSYLAKQAELRLISGEDATVNSTFIYAIEALQPPKAAALLYLDQGETKPEKKAKVIIHRGDSVPPVVEEYAVFPIPNPSQHSLLTYENREDPIPFYKRTPNNHVDEEAFLSLLEVEIAKINPILMAITGLPYVNCSEDCLTWTYGGPANYGGENRNLLFGFNRDFEGWFLHPIGLEVLMEMPGIDIKEWKITWVFFRGMTFSSFDAMRDYYKNITPKPDKYQPSDDESLPSSQYFRGEPRPKEMKKGPRSTYPNGPRFTVSNNYVEWLGWSLEFGMPTTSGPRLHDIRFLGDRIAYEISLQQASIYYSGHTAFYSHTKYFDTFFNSGTTFSRMFRGVDCPLNAHFADTVHYFLGKITTFKDTICIFELDRGVPMRRHFSTDYEGGYYFYNGIPDNVLVFRTILTVENYDYIHDFMFHQGGQIETIVSLSGYILGSYYYTPEQDKYGYKVGEELIGSLHSHFFNFKVDLDVKGLRNRFRTLQIDTHAYPDPVDSSRMLINKYINESVKKTEKEAAYKYNFETPKYLVMYNEDSKNKFGNTRGYRILNNAMTKQLEPADFGGGKSRSWGEYQVAVTQRKDSEPLSSALGTYMDQDNPTVNFEDFISDDENILDEDLVAWVTVGSHHIPIAEDIPIVQTPGAQLTFYLIPFNYFDEDPSLASRDNIRVEPGEEEGQHTYHFSGVAADSVCDREGITCEGTVAKNVDENEKITKDCPSSGEDSYLDIVLPLCVLLYYSV